MRPWRGRRQQRRLLHHIAGRPVDGDRHPVVVRAVRLRLDHELAGHGQVQSRVGVPGHDHVDRVVHLRRLVDDLARGLGALLERAGVREHDDRLDPAAPQLRHPAVDGVGDVREAVGAAVLGQQQRRRVLGGHADEAHAHTRALDGLVGGQERARRLSRSTVFAAMYGIVGALPVGVRGVRRAGRRVRCPPRISRSISAPPSSNSWLPTVPTSKRIMFVASMAGSSWK